MQSIYMYSLLSMGGLAALLAFGLGFASKKFAVEKDKRIDEVEEALPGANCGACGYAGCSAFAEAVVSGEAPVDGCPVGGDEAAEKISEIMGKESSAVSKKTAHVLCRGGWKETSRPSEYQGIKSCRAANMVSGGTKACQYGCLGLGDCVEVCPFDAMKMNDDGLPEVDPEKCTACGKCVEICPKNIIKLVPEEARIHVNCSSIDSGKRVRKICEIGCIGCGLCAKICPVDAISMEDNLAVIDYDKCVGCGQCAKKCPTGAIVLEK